MNLTKCAAKAVSLRLGIAVADFHFIIRLMQLPQWHVDTVLDHDPDGVCTEGSFIDCIAAWGVTPNR
jgi:hypothetical protein